MTRDEIIEKIKKLLRMKRGGTQAEVETALRLAQELAAKHGVNLDDVNPDDESSRRTRPLGHEDAIRSARIQWECKYAGLIVQRFFNVEVLLRNVRVVRNGWPCTAYALTLIGEEWDRQVALYVFHFLAGHFRREWKTRRGRCRNRQAFLYGMYVGLATKLEEQRNREFSANQPGLVRLDQAMARRRLYMEQTFGQTRTSSAAPDSDAEAAKIAGFRAGQDTEIRGGLKGDAAAAAPQLRNEQGQLLLT